MVCFFGLASQHSCMISYNNIHSLRTGIRSRVQPTIHPPIYGVVRHLRVSEMRIGLVFGKNKQLPHCDAVRPDVCLLREHAVEALVAFHLMGRTALPWIFGSSGTHRGSVTWQASQQKFCRRGSFNRQDLEVRKSWWRGISFHWQSGQYYHGSGDLTTALWE